MTQITFVCPQSNKRIDNETDVENKLQFPFFSQLRPTTDTHNSF